jgi:hypothetical protein
VKHAAWLPTSVDRKRQQRQGRAREKWSVKRREESMRKIDQLTVGSTVVFSKKPIGSWLTEEVP